MKSETPLTDAVAFEATENDIGFKVVKPDFARELERRVDASRKSEEAMRIDYEILCRQLKLCEEHAGTMAKDFDKSLAIVQAERDRLKQCYEPS